MDKIADIHTLKNALDRVKAEVGDYESMGKRLKIFETDNQPLYPDVKSLVSCTVEDFHKKSIKNIKKKLEEIINSITVDD